MERLRCDNRRLLAATDWRPQYDLESGLAETIEWIRLNMDLYKTDLYNV